VYVSQVVAAAQYPCVCGAAAAGLIPRAAATAATSPTLNLFNAARRVTDWAIALVSSSNLLFMCFLSVLVLLFVSLCRENDQVTCGSAFAHLLIRRKKMAVTLS
jgi:hypothetical protein